MRRVFYAFVLVGVVACGKSRLGDPAWERWDDRTADSACRHANFSREEAKRPKHAVRKGADARLVATPAVSEWIGRRDRRAPLLAMDEEATYGVRGGWIARLVRDGQRLETLARIESPVTDLVLADGYVYWAEQGEPRMECRPHGTLSRVRIGGGPAEALARDLDEADGLLVVKDHVYVSTAEGLVRVPPNGTSATLFPTPEPAVGRPALDPVSWTVYVETRKNTGATNVVAFPP